MRLKHLHIKSSYKNLKDFKVDFDGGSFIDVLVGKNGTGKSNLFEAVIEIFRHLYEKDYPITFSYVVKYELEDKPYEICWEKEKLLLNKEEVKLVSKRFLPDNILVYYSGHNFKITDLVNDYEDSFKRELKEANVGDTREFIGIGKEYKALLLAVLLLQPDGNKAKEFIQKKLGIVALRRELRVELKRPYYAKKKGYEIDPEVKETAFWRPAGITKAFLDKLSTVKRSESKVIRNEGYFQPGEEYDDFYILYFNADSFRETFSELTPQAIFREFDNLKTIEMLKNISLDIRLEDGTLGSINHFSDGQFQSVYIYSVIELFKDRDCLTLLDEPDSFLHPEWQYQFLKQVFEITDRTIVNNHIIMSSHSAVTLIPCLNEKVRFFDFKEGGLVHSFLLPKRVAINKLSSNLISYSEQEQILSIINTIQIENKPVLFTEGKTDPLIITEAWNKLYPDVDMPFIPFYAFGHKYLVQLMQDPEVIGDMKGLPIFGLFDYDKAFNSWNGFSKIDISQDIYSCLIKQMEKNEVYAIMLPVPKDKPISLQVINPDTGGTYGEHSLMTIEHLFSHVPELKELFVADLSLPSKFKRFQGDKVAFAKKVVPALSKKNFEVFKPMFEFIKSKC